MSFTSTLMLAVMIVLTVFFSGSIYLKDEKLYFVGATDSPDYVGHGEVRDIDDYTCYDSDVVGYSEKFYLYGDKLYSRKMNGLGSHELVVVKSFVDPKNKNKLVTSINSESNNKAIRVPLLLRCEEKEKEVVGVNSLIKSGLELVSYDNLCGKGKPILPAEKEDIVSEDVLFRTNITFDSKDDNLVVQREVLGYSESNGSAVTYPVDIDKKTQLDLNAENYPLKIKCSYEIGNKNIDNG